MSLPALLIRPSVSADLCAMRDIDAHAVVHGTGSFKLEVPPHRAEMVARCQTAGACQMSAVIGDGGKLGSIGVHRALGFERCAWLQAVGRKFVHWLGAGLMQRTLGASACDVPAGGAT
ncbi:MAG: GNAT family N-acetyltransferase [Rubrivivax sp.]